METVLMVTRLKTVLGFLTATIFNSVQAKENIFFPVSYIKTKTKLQKGPFPLVTVSAQAG